MIYFFILLFATLSMGQLFRLDLWPGVTIYPHDVVTGVLLLFFWFKNGVKVSDWKKEPIFKPLLFFGFIGFLSLLFNPLKLSVQEIAAAGLYLGRFFLYASLYFVVLESLRNKSIAVSWLLNGLLGVGVITSVFGLIQLVLYPNIRNISYLGWDPHFGRLVSVYLDPNFTGLILAFSLILSLAFFSKNKQLANRYLVAGSLVLGLPALIFTWSRSSYLAFALGSFLVFWQRKAMRIFLVMMLIVIVVIILLPKPKGEGGNLSRQSTTTARIANWSKSFELFTRQPIFGYGFNTMRYLNLKTGFILPAEFSLNHSAGGLDNSFLFVLATTGVVGFLSYLWLLQTMVKMGLKALKKSRQIGLAFVATFLSLVFHSFFQNSLFYPFNLIWMWLLLASVRKDSGQARMT